MELSNLDYKYLLRGENEFFSLFEYSFNVPLVGTEKEQVQDIIKPKFKVLEELVESVYSTDRYEKERKGKVTPRVGSFGYRYQPEKLTHNLFVDLSYRIPRNTSSGSASISLHNTDSIEENLLRLYARVMDLDELTLSDDAKRTQKDIHGLRNYGSSHTMLSL